MTVLELMTVIPMKVFMHNIQVPFSMDVDVSTDYDEAVELLIHKQYDVIVLDNTPDLIGFITELQQDAIVCLPEGFTLSVNALQELSKIKTLLYTPKALQGILAALQLTSVHKEKTLCAKQ